MKTAHLVYELKRFSTFGLHLKCFLLQYHNWDTLAEQLSGDTLSSF